MIRSIAAACSLICSAMVVHAQPATTYPDRAVRMVVPFPAGGSTDVIARALGQKMSEKLKQAVVIDNKAGANGIIGADIVAKSKPDGYTLLLSIDSTWSMNQFLFEKLPYRPLQDLDPVAKLGVIPIAVVSSPKGPQTLAELVQLAKKKPGQLTFAYGAVTSQVAGDILAKTLGIEVRGIPYKGSSGVLSALLANDVDFALDTTSAEGPFVQSGKLKLLGNMSKAPIPGFADVRTVASIAGDPAIDVAYWIGLAVPRGTAQEIVSRLTTLVEATLRSPDFEKTMHDAGVVPQYLPPPEFRKFYEAEATRWEKAIPAAGIKPN